MITKIIIPVIDTESGEYKFEGNLTREDYEDMVMEQFQSTDRQVGRFVDNMMRGISNMPSNSRYNVTYDRDDYPEIKYNFYEAEAFIQNSKRDDINENFFNCHIEKQDMFILLLNINPNTLNGDAESEIRFWLEGSKRVHNDKTLDDKTKLESLSKRDLKVKLNNNEYGILEGCKILQDYSNNKWPFYFAIIVEKITLEK